MNKLLIALAFTFVSLSAGAEQIMRGEISAGSYGNVKTDSNGYLYTTASASPPPAVGTMTDRSGSITLGGTAQVIMASNATRKYLFIQNTSDTTMWCNFTTTAVSSQPSIMIIAGASFVMEGSIISTEAVSCIGSTTGKVFTAKEI